MDKSSGAGRLSLYFNMIFKKKEKKKILYFFFNMILSVLNGPLSYVDNGHFSSKFGQILWLGKTHGRQEGPTAVGTDPPYSTPLPANISYKGWGG